MKPTQWWHHDPCVWCGRKVKRMTREHIVPLALGGAVGSENQAMACRECNGHRGHVPMLLWLLALKVTGHSHRAAKWVAKQRREYARSCGIRFVGDSR